MSTIVSASLLGCDLANLKSEVARAKNAGVDWLHFDVMDGNFVDNISFGLPVLKSLNNATDMFIDVHLMIDSPERYVDKFVDFGGDIITFHLEATKVPEKVISIIKDKNVKVGISIKPKTPASAVYKYLDKVDMILVMTVEPGFGGQCFLPNTLNKVKDIRTKINELGLNVDIQVDGGINDITAPQAIQAGSNVIVSGTYIFAAKDMAAAVKSIR